MEKRLKFISLGLLVSLSVLWIFVIPPLQTPDEQAHLRYMQFIAENKRLPNKNDIQDNEILENSDAIENLIEQTQADRVFHNRTYHFDFENPEPTQIEGFNAAHIYNHPPLYYLWGAIFLLAFGSFGILRVLYIVRFSNLIFIIFNYLFAFKAASLFSKNRWFRAAAALLVSLWPAFMFGNSGINSDVFLFTSFFAALYYLLKIYKSNELKSDDLLKISMWSVVGILTKAQFLAFFPIVLVLVLWKIRKNFSIDKMSSFFAPLIIPVLYFARNLLGLGSLFPDPSGKTGIITDNYFSSEATCRGLSILSYLKALLYPRYVLIFKGFAGNFGWLDTQLPRAVYLFLSFVFLLSIVFFLYWFVFGLKRKTLRTVHFLLLTPVIPLELFYIYLYFNGYISRCYENFPTQGRYYFPMLLSFVLMGLLGLKSVIPVKFKDVFYKLIILFAVFFNVFCLAMLTQRYYL